MTRTRRSVWNLAAGLLFTAATMATGLLATPLLLRFLGEERFGASRAAADWLGWLTVLEFGLSGSLSAVLARGAARNDQTEMRHCLSLGIRAYAAIGLLMGIVVLVASPFIDRLVPVGESAVSDLRLSLVAGIFGCLLFVPLSPCRIFVEAEGRGYRIAGLLTLQGLLTTALSVAAAWAGGGITGQAVAIVIGQIPLQVVLAREVFGRFPGLAGAVLHKAPDPEVSRELRSLNGPAFALNVSGRLSLLSDNIVVAGLLGSAAVVPLILTQRLAVLCQGQIQSMGNSVWVGLAQLHVAGRRSDFNARLAEVTGLTAALGTAILVPVFAYNRHFVSLWVGPQQWGGDWIGALAAVNGLLLGVFSLWGWCFSGTGKVRAITPIFLMQAALNLVVSVAATLLFGAVGPLVGTFVAFAAITIWRLPLALRREFGTPLRPLFASVARPVIVGVPYAAALWCFTSWHTPAGWFGLAGEMGLAAIAYVLLSWMLVLDEPQRRQWRDRLQSILRPAGA